MRLAIDSNVLVYAADNEAGARHDAAVDLIRRAAAGDTILPLQVLGEFFAVVTRQIGLPPKTAAGFVEDWQGVFLVAAAVPETIDHAIAAVIAHDLQFWDAMIWAVADVAGCDILLTEDMQDGRRLGRVQFVNPFDPANARLVDTILPSP